jgi:hypothetical protein
MTEGQKRADRIIQEEMLRVGAQLRKARGYDEWLAAHLELEELGRAGKQIYGKLAPTRETPNLEGKRQDEGAALNRGLFDGN